MKYKVLKDHPTADGILYKGEIVKERHIRRIRPGFGLPPEYLSSVIGKKVTRDVFRGDRVDQGNIEITVKTWHKNIEFTIILACFLITS